MSFDVLGVVAIVISFASLYFSNLQFNANKNLLIFDKRMNIYLALEKILYLPIREDDISKNDILCFRPYVDESKFLFSKDKDMQDFLDKIVKNAYEFNCAVENINKNPTAEDNEEVVAKKLELKLWFGEQREVSEQLFGKYLNV